MANEVSSIGGARLAGMKAPLDDQAAPHGGDGLIRSREAYLLDGFSVCSLMRRLGGGCGSGSRAGWG